ncbi:MAG: TldD/PmbA family protein [Gemmatimonadales bacterium]|nr:TldD/PmbA family protein [Gemmatimonadales bacterium]
MIEKTLELASRRATAADAILRDESQLTLKFESGRLKENALHQEAGLNLRVFTDGRYGVAGTTDLAGIEDVVSRAFASAEQGDALTFELPRAQPVPGLSCFDDRAAGMDVASLAAIGRSVVERLSRPGWQVNASMDRSVETTTFANTTGQSFTYRATAVSVSAEVVRVSGDDVLMVYDDASSNGIPDDAELARIVTSILTRMERAERIVEPPEGKLPVLFTPNGSAAVFMPLRQALSGKSVLQGVSPLGGKLGEVLFDSALTLFDDPLVPGRVGSRPADDEGVPSRRLSLVERGTVRAFVYDLETAARAKTASTGHGRRGTFGKPGISYSNLVMDVGALDEAALLKEVGHGLIVDELIGVGQGNVVGGAFSHPVALAFRVDGGEITGRVKDAAVAGNGYELLKRIRAIGKDAKWNGGTRLVPPIVIDAVNVARR